MLGSLLETRGYSFTCVGDIASATRALAAEHFDAVLLDMYLPDGEGPAVLARALELDPAPAVLMMTARAEIRAAVEAVRRGASDFLEKPLDLEDLATRLDRAQENVRLRRKLAAYEANDREASSAVVKSSALKEAFAVAARVASTPASSALILGESGVGKEVLAARIHEMSDRRNGPFVRVNLAAIPESMIEAELFGSVRGAFTDSKRDRAGHFASAEGGTILLDEICEFKPELQPKLLRALEERRFFPVGSDRERRMNVRIVAATNRDPQECIAKGTLRADLYYRLATVVLRVPPLRERRDDIGPLAEHFCERFRAEFRRPRLALSAAAREALLAYDWPGNVREMKNVIERAAMLAESDAIGPDDLGLPLDSVALKAVAASATPDGMRLEDAERLHILRVLESSGGRGRARPPCSSSRARPSGKRESATGSSDGVYGFRTRGLEHALFSDTDVCRFVPKCATSLPESGGTSRAGASKNDSLTRHEPVGACRGLRAHVIDDERRAWLFRHRTLLQRHGRVVTLGIALRSIRSAGTEQRLLAMIEEIPRSPFGDRRVRGPRRRLRDSPPALRAQSPGGRHGRASDRVRPPRRRRLHARLAPRLSARQPGKDQLGAFDCELLAALGPQIAISLHAARLDAGRRRLPALAAEVRMMAISKDSGLVARTYSTRSSPRR